MFERPDQSPVHPWQYRRNYETAFAELQCDSAWRQRYPKLTDDSPEHLPEITSQIMGQHNGFEFIGTPADTQAERAVANGLFEDVVRYGRLIG